MTEGIFAVMQPQIKAKNQQLNIRTSNIIHEDLIGDTLRLRQVFVNIMGNAVKFTPAGGSRRPISRMRINSAVSVSCW